MPRVIFVAPFGLSTTLRFVRAVAGLPDVALAIVSQEALDKIPADVRQRLVAFDRIGDAQDSAELEASVKRLAAKLGGQVDRIIGVLEQLQVPIAKVRERLRIPGMDVAEAENFRDKSRMKDRLREHGVPCAAHRLCASSAEALAFADEVGFPIVVKPQAGAGAKNTLRVHDREQLQGILRSWPLAAGQEALLEQFLTGREHSFDTVSLGGRHLLHSITRYFPTPLEVLENPWIQWCVVLPRRIDTPEYEDIVRVGKEALDVLGMHTGITHMEWFRLPDGGLAISEVAARPPGAQFTSLLSWAHQHDFYQSWARLVCCDEFDVPERSWAVGAAFLRGQGAGRVAKIHGIDTLRSELGDVLAEVKLPQIGQPQASSYEGEGYVIVRAQEDAEVEAALGKVVRSVKIELG